MKTILKWKRPEEITVSQALFYQDHCIPVYILVNGDRVHECFIMVPGEACIKFIEAYDSFVRWDMADITGWCSLNDLVFEKG